MDEGDTAVGDKNFRLKWANLYRTVEILHPSLIYCCTASCTPEQQAELIARCGLRLPHVVRLSSRRDNFSYIQAGRNEYGLVELLRRHSGEKTIVYFATVRTATQVHELLLSCGYATGTYFGPMAKPDKDRVLIQFQIGELKTVLATCAFGRGVDIADIRNIVLYDPPRNISEFAQQAGRAGRDGKPSRIYICNRQAEDGWQAQRFLLDSQHPPLTDLEIVWNHLRSFERGRQATQREIAREAGAQSWKYGAGAIFQILKQHDLTYEHHLGRAYTWFAFNKFDEVDWSDYLTQKPKALQDLEDLRRMWSLPGEAIPDALAEYLDGEPLRFDPDVADEQED